MSKKLILILILLLSMCGCETKNEDEYYDYFVKCAETEARLKIDNVYGYDEECVYKLRVHLLDEGKVPYYFFVEKDDQPIFGMSFIFEKETIPENVTTYKYKAGYLIAVIDEIAEGTDKKDLEYYNKKDTAEKINDLISLSDVKKISKNEIELTSQCKAAILTNLPEAVQKCKSYMTLTGAEHFTVKGFVKQYSLKLNDKETEITIQQSEVLLCALYCDDVICYLIGYDVETGERTSIVTVSEDSIYYSMFNSYDPVMWVNIGEYPYNRTLFLSAHSVSNDLILAQNEPFPVMTQKALAQLKSLAGSSDDLNVLYSE